MILRCLHIPVKRENIIKTQTHLNLFNVRYENNYVVDKLNIKNVLRLHSESAMTNLP